MVEHAKGMPQPCWRGVARGLAKVAAGAPASIMASDLRGSGACEAAATGTTNARLQTGRRDCHRSATLTTELVGKVVENHPRQMGTPGKYLRFHKVAAQLGKRLPVN